MIVYSTYPELIIQYSSYVDFKNITIQYYGARIVLNGIVVGLLYAKYVFRENNIIVTLRYTNFSTKGFYDELSREYILMRLSEKQVYVFNKSEQPYDINKAFIIEGGIKYYVSPNYLDFNGVVDQSINFILDNYTILSEKRYFRYDSATGILVDLYVNSKIFVNNSINTNYTIQFKLYGSSNYRLYLNKLSSSFLTILALLTLIVFTTIICLLKILKKA